MRRKVISLQLTSGYLRIRNTDYSSIKTDDVFKALAEIFFSNKRVASISRELLSFLEAKEFVKSISFDEHLKRLDYHQEQSEILLDFGINNISINSNQREIKTITDKYSGLLKRHLYLLGFNEQMEKDKQRVNELEATNLTLKAENDDLYKQNEGLQSKIDYLATFQLINDKYVAITEKGKTLLTELASNINTMRNISITDFLKEHPIK